MKDSASNKIRQMKTPYFLIREELLAENIRGFSKALIDLWPNSIIAYSVKTNSLPWVLNWMNEHGAFAEVVSDEEYQLALLSGYTGEKIVFNGPIKSDSYLETAFAAGSIINVDSTNELIFILRKKPDLRGKIGLRVNVDPSIFNGEDVSYQKDGFRFGFSYENGELEKAIRILKSVYGNIPIGLHMHINSITRSIGVYQALARYAAKIILETKIKPSYIDIGGGFFGGVPGKPTPHEYIKTINNILKEAVNEQETLLIIEPGSAAIGSAVELHTTVLDVKDTLRGRIVTTDGSRIHIDPLWIKKSYTYTTDSKLPLYHRQVICGYTCMDHDRIMILENSPEIQMGDHIVYHRVGNYSVTFGGPFIQPFPDVYVESNQDISIIRKKMSMEDYYKMESIMK